MSTENKNKLNDYIVENYDRMKDEYIALQYKTQQFRNANNKDQEIQKKYNLYNRMTVSEASIEILRRSQQQHTDSQKRNYYIKWQDYLPDQQNNIDEVMEIKWYQNRNKTTQFCQQILSKYESQRQQSVRSNKQNLTEVNEEILRMKKSLTEKGILENREGDNNGQQEESQRNIGEVTQINRLDELEKSNNKYENEQKLNQSVNDKNNGQQITDKINGQQVNDENNRQQTQKQDKQVKDNKDRQQIQKQNVINKLGEQQAQKEYNNNQDRQKQSQQDDKIDNKSVDINRQEAVSYKNTRQEQQNRQLIQQQENKQQNCQENIQQQFQNKQQKQQNKQNIQKQQKQKVLDTSDIPYQNNIQNNIQNTKQKNIDMPQKQVQISQNHNSHTTKQIQQIQNHKNQLNNKQSPNRIQNTNQLAQSRQTKQQRSQKQQKQSNNYSGVQQSPNRKSIFQLEGSQKSITSDKKYYQVINTNSPRKDTIAEQQHKQHKQHKQIEQQQSKQNNQELIQSQQAIQIKQKQRKQKKKKVYITQTHKKLDKLDNKFHKIYEFYYRHVANTKKKGLNFDTQPQGLDLQSFIKYLKQYEIAQGLEKILGRKHIREKIIPTKKISQPKLQVIDKKKQKNNSKKNTSKLKNQPKKKDEKKRGSKKQDKILQNSNNQPPKQQPQKHKQNSQIHLRLHIAETIKYLSALFKKKAINGLWLNRKGFDQIHQQVFQIKQDKKQYVLKLQQIKKNAQNTEQAEQQIRNLPQKLSFIKRLQQIHQIISNQKINKTLNLNINVIHNLSNAFNQHPDRLRSIVQKHVHSSTNNFENHREQLIKQIRKKKIQQQQRHKRQVQRILERYKARDQKIINQQQNKSQILNKTTKTKSLHKINSYAKVLSLKKQQQAHRSSPLKNISRIRSQNKINQQYLQKNLDDSQRSSPKNSIEHNPIENRIEIYRQLNLPKLSKRKLRDQSIYESLNLIDTKNQIQKIKKMISQTNQDQADKNRHKQIKHKNKKKSKQDEQDPYFREYYEKQRKKINEEKQKSPPQIHNRMKFT